LFGFRHTLNFFLPPPLQAGELEVCGKTGRFLNMETTATVQPTKQFLGYLHCSDDLSMAAAGGFMST
jgi:hypothetical protein